MNRLRTTLLSLSLATMALGCNTVGSQPEIQRAVIEPGTLKPGDSAVITLEVVDKNAIIERIEGVVVEDPRITFRLRDDGEAPDLQALDGIWSMKVDVPFTAPEGDFKLEFTAYRSDGQPVPVRDSSGDIVSLSESLAVVITYGEEQS